MRRTAFIAVLSLGLAIFLIPSSHASVLGIGKLGIGAYGLSDIPIAQDDAGNGPLYGARARLGILPILFAEASATFINNGDKDLDFGGQLEAPELKSYAINALLKTSGIGFSMYLTVGTGWTKVTMPGSLGEENEATYNAGIGAEIGLGPISVDLSPRLFIINTADGASRKHLTLMAGINYYFN